MFLQKGNVSVFYYKKDKNNEDIYKKLQNLPSILDALFKILITSDDEPILISGPSSFKTYLAELLFLNSKKYEVIALNSELTISQLVGSLTLLTTEKAKYYYLKQIYEILQVNNIGNLLKDLEDFEGNKEKIKKNIEEFEIEFIKNKDIDDFKKYPFYYALKKFKEKLFEEQKDKKSLFNMIIEFNPGIFVSSLIKGFNLILKNITAVKTENLERLNEALTGNKKITLNEDTQDSFTPKNNKEIKFNNFRIIGTCGEGQETSLSEAFLSRFTLIYVDKYEEDEEENVLKKCSENNNEQNINEEDNQEMVDVIDLPFLKKKLKDYYDFCKNNHPVETTMNLAQKLNCIEIIKEMNKKTKNNSYEKGQNINLVLYYLLKGLNEKINEKFNEKFNEKLNEINDFFEINKYHDKLDLSPLVIEDNYKLKSTLNNIVIKINRMEKKEEKGEKQNISLAFTTKIKEIIDTIHFAIFTGTPLILEGAFGQGKKSAIKYYAKMAKLELDFIPITKSTKVDDLLGKTTFKKNEKGNITLENSNPPLLEAIKYEGNFPNTLIVLEGINNASPAVLEVLNSIYGKKGTKILLPNGSTIEKRNINLISIFNPSDDFTREKLPGNLLNNSIYLVVENPDEKDNQDIINKLFIEAGLENEQTEFEHYFKKAQDIAKNAEGEFPFTLHEVRKYISFRKSIDSLDKNYFIFFIFNNHFNKSENINKIREEFEFDKLTFNPTIDYYDNNKFLVFNISKKGHRNILKIEIKNHEKIKPKELKDKFNAITIDEKLCILFLLCCVKANKTPIIQGVTASGKSFIVKLFSELLGQEMSIYQLNSNSGISIFTGQSVMKKDFDENEKLKLKDLLKLLNKNDKKVEEINSQDFIKFTEEIKQKLDSDKLTEAEKIDYENALDTLIKLKSPLNRFIPQDSELITGIKTGKWITFDGLEMANSQISEKLSSLCDESPTLNVFESGSDELNFKSNNINPDFRMFIIYNSLSKNANKIDQSLFNKCVKFILYPIDSSPRDATTILYENIINNIQEPDDIDKTLWSNLCSRISRYHVEKVKETKEKPDLVAGNVPFTSRHLCFISTDFNHSDEIKKSLKSDDENKEDKEYKYKVIISWLISIFDNYYWRSFNDYPKKDKKIFLEETKEIIKMIPDYQYKVEFESDYLENFKEIMECLIGIQNYAIRNNEYKDFNFAELLDHCLKVPFNEENLQNIYNNFEDTILILDNDYNIDKILKNRFYQILFIKNNYQNLMNCLKNESENQSKLYLSRMRFLNLILKEENKNNIYNPDLNYELFTPYTNELCNVINNLIKNKDKKSFEKLIKFLVDHPTAFKIIRYYYPYNNKELKEGELKYANHFIYYFSLLYNKQINFSIRIKDQRYDIEFKESQANKSNPYFIFNEEKSLYLSNGSFVKKNYNDNPYTYLDISPEINTENMLEWLQIYFKSLYNDFPKENNIDELQLETSNFFKGNKSTLISRIWSLLINLTDKYSNVIAYLKNNCCFLENDTIKKFEDLFQDLDLHDLKEIIKNMKNLSFFCDSSSILWKYRILLSNLKKGDKEENYFGYFKNKKIKNKDEEINSIKKELDNLNKLKIYWKDSLINNYKEKLNTLILIINSYSNKDNEKPEITKLRKDAKNLLINLEEKVKNKIDSGKLLDDMKEEIIDFINAKAPTSEEFQKLQKKVKIFTNLIKQKETDILNLPNKNNKIKIIDTSNYKIYELIFWYSLIEENLNDLLNSKTSYETYWKLTMNLNKYSELDPIMTFIGEKKLKLNEEKPDFFVEDTLKAYQMLRGILLFKIKNYKINLDDFNKIVEAMNSKLKNPDLITYDEYMFSYIISDDYPKNLKIKMPVFQIIDAFFFFCKYDKYDNYKLGNFFNGININFAGLREIAENFLNPNVLKNYNNMVTLSKDLVKSFHYQIFNKHIKDGEILNLSNFLKNESIKAKSNNEKKFLERIAEAFDFIEAFQKKIFENQNENNYKFDLDDFENLLDDKKNLMNCSEIFKKEKNGKDKSKSLFSPSFLFYINNNQADINNLFNDINKSKKSIIFDKNKNKENKDEEKIDYLPFWLYILRNVSSLNCIEYNKNEIEKSIANNIVFKIKNKISDCLQEKKPLNLKWMNLILDNISFELLDPTIHLFFYFFNSLVYSLNLSDENLKYFAKKELEKYFFEIIDSVFNENINQVLNEDINDDDKTNIILKFTKDPSNYLYEKIKEDYNNKFNSDMIINGKNNILELNDSFNKKFEEISNNFISKIEETNKKLFEEEYQKLKDATYEKNYNNLKELITKYSNEIFLIENKFSERKFGHFNNFGKPTELTIFQTSYEKLKFLKETNSKLLNYGIKGKKEGKLKCYSLPYDFTTIKHKKYNLYYLNQLIKTDMITHKGTIYLFVNKGCEIYSNNFKINEVLNHIPYNNPYINNQKYTKTEDKKIENLINFKEAQGFYFSKFEKNEEEIKNFVRVHVKMPFKDEVKNPPEILLSNYNIKQFKFSVDKLKKSSNNLYKIFSLIKEKKINDKLIVENLEKEIENILKLLIEVKEMLKLNPNNFENLIDLSKELEKEISDYYSNLNDYYEKYKQSLKEKLNKFFGTDEKNIFSLDFALPEIPKEITKLGIDLEKMNKDSKNLCVPIINLDSEGKDIICCYKSLELNLGQICPTLYYKPYIINIISFINEDLKITIKDYNKKNKIKKQEKKEEEKEKEKENQDEDEGETLKEEKYLINIENDKEYKYLSTKEFIKKGENIQLFVEIPQILYIENTMEIASIINIESSSGKTKDLPINITLSTIPISCLISCSEYKLIKGEMNEDLINKDEDNNSVFKYYFKLDTHELLGDEEINFELLNYKEKEPLEFYLSLKSLKKILRE